MSCTMCLSGRIPGIEPAGEKTNKVCTLCVYVVFSYLWQSDLNCVSPHREWVDSRSTTLWVKCVADLFCSCTSCVKSLSEASCCFGRNDECKQDHTFKIKSYILCNQLFPVGSSAAIKFKFSCTINAFCSAVCFQPVPYSNMIPGGMFPKRTIIIRGMVPYGADRCVLEQNVHA